MVLGLSTEESHAYITGEPANDAQFIPAFAHALEHTGGYAPEEATHIAKAMLPGPVEPSEHAVIKMRKLSERSTTTRR